MSENEMDLALRPLRELLSKFTTIVSSLESENTSLKEQIERQDKLIRKGCDCLQERINYSDRTTCAYCDAVMDKNAVIVLEHMALCEKRPEYKLMVERDSLRRDFDDLLLDHGKIKAEGDFLRMWLHRLYVAAKKIKWGSCDYNSYDNLENILAAYSKAMKGHGDE